MAMRPSPTKMPSGMSREGRFSSSASGHVYSTPTKVKMAMPSSAERRLQVRSMSGSALPIGSVVP